MTLSTRQRLIAATVAELERQNNETRDGPYLHSDGGDRIGIDGRVDLGELVDAILANLPEWRGGPCTTWWAGMDGSGGFTANIRFADTDQCRAFAVAMMAAEGEQG